MIVLIPAYEPDGRLIDLVESIRRTENEQRIVIVDDGSGPEYLAVFDAVAARGCEVVSHQPNRGKGFALKHGFAYISRRYPSDDVVCADCDGQHAVADIVKVAAALAPPERSIVLGSRTLEADAPLRSRFGNGLTRRVYRAATGTGLRDTQTGLRAYAASLLPWLQGVRGDRFEYELEVLLAAQRSAIAIHEVPIETIYLDGNKSSHFRTVHDSIRVYVPFVKFGMSSLTAFAIDTALFFVVMTLTGSLALAVITARTTSATFNYLANRRIVFKHRRSAWRRSAWRYATLVAVLMGANYLLLHLLTERMSFGLVSAKALTEATLFVVSYLAQRRHVFGREDPAPAGSASQGRARARELAA